MHEQKQDIGKSDEEIREELVHNKYAVDQCSERL